MMAPVCMLGLCLGLVLSCFASHVQGAVSYERTATLSSTGNFSIAWKVEAPRIYLALQATTTGWMAFGLGEPTSGSMPGADILVAGLNSQGVAYVQDRYAVAKATPLLDVDQDWTVTEGSRVNGVTTIHAWRLLDTGNKAEDRVFLAGPLKVIYALGLGSTDFVYHDVNRGAIEISFHGASIPVASALGGTPSTYLVNNYTIPAQKKTYACKGFDLEDMVTPRHVIAFEPVLSPASAKYVHHIVFHACTNSAWFNQYKTNTAECSSPVGQASSGCTEVFWMWAVGSGPFVLPADVGVRIGTGGITRILMQFHYDNPARLAGIVDSSGFRMYSQTTLRAHDAGVMILGDPFTMGGTIPATTSFFHKEFACNPACTQTFTTPITVYASALHMHAYGKQMWTTQHNSSGALVRVTNKIEYWDFEFQQFSPLEPFIINKGDRLNTHCVYDTTSTIAPVTFGTDSLQEMCFDFVMYFPKMQNFDYCAAAGAVSVCAQGVGLSENLLYPDPPGQEVRIFGNPNTLSSSTGSSVMSSSSGRSASTGSDVTITYPLTINGVNRVYTATRVIGSGITLYWKVTGGVLDLVCRRINSGWLAFGFGSTMLGSHAILGWKTISNASSVAVYALTAKMTSGVQPVSATVASDYVTSHEVDIDAAGYTSLRITRPLALSSGTISLTTATDMIFAYSSQVPTTATTVRQHDAATTASVLFSATGGGGVSSARAGARASVWSAVTVLALVALALSAL